MRTALCSLITLAVLLTSVASAQLLTGDVLLATTSGYTHIRAVTSTSVVPVAADGNTMSVTSFGDGSIAFIPNSDLMVVGEGGGNLYLLDFSSSISAPSSWLLGTTPGAIRSLGLDRASGDLYVLTLSGDIYPMVGPISSSTIVGSSPVVTGQVGGIALDILPNGRFLIGGSVSLWEAAVGDTATGATTLTLSSAGTSDLIYDASADRVLVSFLGSSRVDVYDYFTGTLINTPVTPPAALVLDSLDFDESTDSVYYLARLNAQVGGLPYGVQTSNDNVIVSVGSLLTTAAAVGISPSAGHGNSGSFGYIALVKSFPAVTKGLRFDPTTATATFDTTAGTMTASATIDAVLGLPMITSSAVDSLIGATVNFSGSITGTDGSFLSDIVITNLDVDIHETNPGGAPDATISSAAPTNDGVVATFEGPLFATPRAERRFTLAGPTTSGPGTASPSLTAMLAQLGGAPALKVDFTGDGTSIPLTLEYNPTNGINGFEFRGLTSGAGDFELGIVNTAPFAEIFMLFTTIISTPTGSGPFLGLAADPGIFIQATQPLGSAPFHVLANVNGQYNFTLPTGFVPAGLVFDYMIIEHVPGLVTLHAVTNITF